MSKQHKILIGVFCIGVLLCGLGMGVTFTEFSRLSYGGRQVIGKTVIKTENIDVTYEPGEEKLEVVGWCRNWGQTDVITDDSVPENTVRFKVTYNAERVMPIAYWNEGNGRIVFNYQWNGWEDSIGMLMESKDLVLQNLKAGKIVSLDVIEVEGVTVMVNPASYDDLRIF